MLEEALAIKTTLQMAKDADWKEVKILIDYKEVINRIQANDPCHTANGTVIEDILELIELFSNVISTSS